MGQISQHSHNRSELDGALTQESTLRKAADCESPSVAQPCAHVRADVLLAARPIKNCVAPCWVLIAVEHSKEACADDALLQSAAASAGAQRCEAHRAGSDEVAHAKMDSS